MKHFLFVLISSLFIFSCSSSDDSNNDDQVGEYIIPFVDTNHAQRISLTTARLSGFIEKAPLSVGDFIDEVSNDFEIRGFVWSLTDNPTIENDNVVEDPNNFEGNYYTTLTGLQENTEYFFRAYATNLNNEINYGVTRSFTTFTDPICNPNQDNFISIGNQFPTISNINVSIEDSGGFNDGNFNFEASSSSTNVRVNIFLDEVDALYPLTGTFTSVGYFDNLTIESTNEAIITIIRNGLASEASLGQASFYIEYIPSERITFIFCDTEVGNDYVLNGKFTYSI